MSEKFSTLRQKVLERWHKAAEVEGIPKDAYKPNIRIVESNANPGYVFGIIHNENRFNRPTSQENIKESSNCSLCNASLSAKNNQLMNLITEEKVLDYIFTINKFPIIEGFSLAITEKERPMYTTQKIDNLESELNYFVNFSDKTGFEIFHNSPGFGATIPAHEHWHLTTFRNGYDILGKTYGFDAAEKISCKKTKDISVMPSFPFSHLVFHKEDVKGVVSFLSNVQKELGDKYKNRGVPHTISQGYDGILITIGKEYLQRCKGSGDVAGHIPVKSKEEFDKITHEDCIKEMDKILFRKEEINLEKFI
ncbi:hypothetical protein J4225_02320 [Candidatus Pacearchaeota archaeon]|nr:hypothetical protein [Candidatus Pacearchaeota archaeon]